MRTIKIFVGLVVFVSLLVMPLSVVAEEAGSASDEVMSEEGNEIIEYGGGYRFDKNGWIYLHIEGGPYERGVQHGHLVAGELEDLQRSLEYLTYWNTGKKWEFFVKAASDLFTDHVDEEFLLELRGIADGAKAAGVDITWEEVMAWNGYEELTDYWWPNEKEGKLSSGDSVDNDHCSAFIATGAATRDGKIVMAHNSFGGFEFEQFKNMILDIEPAEGHRMFMQAAPGFIDSGTDFAVTDAGLMVCETTIGGFSLYKINEVPEFVRVRKAMQYADNLDQFVGLMQKHNDGGFANSWLLGDLSTGEIMRFEQGLQYHNIERKTDGYFIGFNAPLDPRIRNLECSNTGYADIRRHQGARQVRLTQLMEEHYGEIDVEVGQEVLADHYDVYLQMEDNPCSRTIDGHYELDAREYMSQPGRPLPYQPRGAVDGKATDSDLARDLAFWARWGNSSGLPFDAEAFLDEHIQWEHLDGYLKDRPAQPWTSFKAGEE